MITAAEIAEEYVRRGLITEDEKAEFTAKLDREIQKAKLRYIEDATGAVVDKLLIQRLLKEGI